MMFVDWLERLRPIRGLPLWARYAATAAIVFACFGFRVALEGLDEAPYLPLYLIFVPAVILSAFLFDRGSGFFAVGLSAVLGLYFFIEPAGPVRLNHIGEAIRLVAFILIGLLSAALVEALRRTVDKLARQTEELTQRTQQLTATRAELMKANQHRDLLLSDINHRIKNHLASVAAGLTLSRSHIKDEEAREALDSAIRRLNILARVYTRLHLEGPEVTLDAKDFFEGLCFELAASLIGAQPIALIPSIERREISAQHAVNLGLIVNELVNNAVKHAFPDGAAGEIHVLYGDTEGHCRLQVLDNGVGRRPGDHDSGAGTKLVKALVGQMGGSIEWQHLPGTRVIVSLPDCEA